MDQADIDRLRDQARRLGRRLRADRPNHVSVEDPSGVRWEVSPGDEQSNVSRSTGETAGRWIERSG